MAYFNDSFRLNRLHASEWKGDHEWGSGANVWRGVLAIFCVKHLTKTTMTHGQNVHFLRRYLKKKSRKRAEAKPLYCAINRNL
jgi:hypothetical protein